MKHYRIFPANVYTAQTTVYIRYVVQYLQFGFFWRDISRETLSEAEAIALLTALRQADAKDRS